MKYEGAIFYHRLRIPMRCVGRALGRGLGQHLFDHRRSQQRPARWARLVAQQPRDALLHDLHEALLRAPWTDLSGHDLHRADTRRTEQHDLFPHGLARSFNHVLDQLHDEARSLENAVAVRAPGFTIGRHDRPGDAHRPHTFDRCLDEFDHSREASRSPRQRHC